METIRESLSPLGFVAAPEESPRGHKVTKVHEEFQFNLTSVGCRLTGCQS